VRVALVTLLTLVLASGIALARPKSVHVMHGWPGHQAVAFARVVDAFMAAYPDINVTVEIVGRDRPAILETRIAAGNPPDVSPIPWLGLMMEWAREGHLVALDGLVDLSEQIPALTPVGMVDGELYGTWQWADVKSLVWYNVHEFRDRGYEIPETWDELIALSDQIVADGGVPWSIGLESGVASGWPGTDWIEDIMLRTAGPDLYDDWWQGNIPFNHPAVREAWEYFGKIVLNRDYVLGGPVGALTTNFTDAPAPLFTDPPGAFLHKQATFIQGFILSHFPGLVPGEDFDVFPFPEINPEFGTPIMGGGNVSIVFDTGGPLNGTREEVIAFVQFLSSVEAQQIWARETELMAANKSIDPLIVYPDDPIARRTWQMLLDAETFRYDASDLMPGAVGAGSFWTGAMDYMAGEDLDRILDYIESTTVSHQGQPPQATFTFSPNEPGVEQTVRFTDTSTAPDGRVVRRRWDFGDGRSSTIQNPSHRYTSPGTYTVKLTVTDEHGGTDTTTRRITVVARPPQATFAYEPHTQEQHLLVNKEVTFDGSESRAPDGDIVRYAWDFGDGHTAEGERVTHTYTEPGAYTVKLTVWDAHAATDTAERELQVVKGGSGGPS